MNQLEIIVSQTPGIVQFDNYSEVKKNLTAYIQNSFLNVDYDIEGFDAAQKDRDQLKKMHDLVNNKRKELETAYLAPYATVGNMLEELLGIIDEPYKKLKKYVDDNEKIQKQKEIMKYAEEKASQLGESGNKIITSPAFFKKDWLLKKYTVKKYKEEIDTIFHQAANDMNAIQSTGGENKNILMARYYETLSMEGVKSFLESINENQEQVDTASVESANNVMGYKILKITATEEQMAFLLNQLELMGADVEELEDGMPKIMEERTVPEFRSFVAFDIETTGTNGAANGDEDAAIIEIGAVKVVDGQVVAKFDELINPQRDIIPRIARLTHITNEMVADKPFINEVLKRFCEFAGDNILIGHNIKGSDLKYITKAANKAGIRMEMPFLDTYILARKYKEQMQWEKLNLSYLAQQYGLTHREVHRAWSDAEVTAQLYFELQKLSEEK